MTQSSTSPAEIDQDQIAPLGSRPPSVPRVTAPRGIPGLKSPESTYGRPVSDSFKSTAPWGENGQPRGHLTDDLFRPTPPPVHPRPDFGHCARCFPVSQPATTTPTLPSNPISWSPAPPVVDACRPFTLSTYRHWKRDVRLRLESPPTATTSQLSAKLSHRRHNHQNWLDYPIWSKQAMRWKLEPSTH